MDIWFYITLFSETEQELWWNKCIHGKPPGLIDSGTSHHVNNNLHILYKALMFCNLSLGGAYRFFRLVGDRSEQLNANDVRTEENRTRKICFIT